MLENEIENKGPITKKNSNIKEWGPNAEQKK